MGAISHSDFPHLQIKNICCIQSFCIIDLLLFLPNSWPQLALGLLLLLAPRPLPVSPRSVGFDLLFSSSVYVFWFHITAINYSHYPTCFLTFTIFTLLLDEAELLNAVAFSPCEVFINLLSIFNLILIITFCFPIKIIFPNWLSLWLLSVWWNWVLWSTKISCWGFIPLADDKYNKVMIT